MRQIAVVLIIGLIGLGNVTRNPRFQAFHAVDVLQLLASGVCFGVALTLAFATFRKRS
ncbi:MAG: hypothetical protein M3Z09_13815 [Acidobacteriota bacterium]|nr:hypothetical protein [Acidobacteriota bacterium]